ncbi:hypothetical protein CBS9595_002676 [Malassezia furfur]|nr:hypothetical protein CBS9595_002676 [Malassezia furfur]
MSRHSPMAHKSNAVDDRSQNDLLVYYCLCGEFVLVCNKALELLPERPFDKSRVLRCMDAEKPDGQLLRAHVYKISASQGEGQMVRRDDGRLEQQYDFLCTRCGLPIGYEHTPPPIKSGGKYTFIFKGALTRKQGQIPPDALQDIANVT